MSVRITTEHGTFEGETLKAANAAARKGAKLAKQKQEKDEANYKLARDKVIERAYQVLSNLLMHGPEKMPRGWQLFSFNDPNQWGSLAQDEFGNWVMTFIDMAGQGRNWVYHGTPIAFVQNGMNCPILYFVRTDEGTVECHAVACVADQFASAPCPTVTMEMFKDLRIEKSDPVKSPALIYIPGLSD